MRRRTAWISRSSLALLAVCFGLFPACVAIVGLRATLLPAAVAVLLTSISIAALYWQHEMLNGPGTNRLVLCGNVAKFVFYPFSAIRCMDLVLRDSLAAFDPIAVTAVLCGRDVAAHLAAYELVTLRFSTTPQEVGAGSAIGEYRVARLRLLESFIAQHDLAVQALIDAPARTDDTCETYCPVCRAQYRLASGVCPDCPDMPLQPLNQPTRRGPAGSQKAESHA